MSSRIMSARIETEADIEAGLAALLKLDPRLEEICALAGPLPSVWSGHGGLTPSCSRLPRPRRVAVCRSRDAKRRQHRGLDRR